MKRTALILALGLTASGAFAASHGQMGGHFIESWDLNEDGQVTLAEATERRSDVFASFDSDDNGVLSSEEYDLFDEARANDMAENGLKGQGQGQGHGNGQGQGKRMSPAQGMQRAFNDADKDGTVTQQEFMDGTADWFAMVDRSGDGVVTTEDFGPRG